MLSVPGHSQLIFWLQKPSYIVLLLAHRVSKCPATIYSGQTRSVLHSFVFSHHKELRYMFKAP
jgi:hypothetical protein